MPALHLEQQDNSIEREWSLFDDAVHEHEGTIYFDIFILSGMVTKAFFSPSAQQKPGQGPRCKPVSFEYPHSLITDKAQMILINWPKKVFINTHRHATNVSSVLTALKITIACSSNTALKF